MIQLKSIDENNWRTSLKVREDQKKHVANSAVLLARAYAYRNCRSWAFLICDDDTPVGMGLYYDYPEGEAYDLSQFFIDERYQGKGYAKAAMKLVLERMKQDGKYQRVILCYVEGNDAAKKLYEGFGFTFTDQEEDEIGMELKF